MNGLRKCFLVLTYTNTIIALAAVAQAALTYLVIDVSVSPYILIIEGASTLLLYNFSLLLSKPVDPQSSPYARTRFFFKHEYSIWAMSALALISLLYATAQINPATVVFLGGIGLLSLVYNMPLRLLGILRGGLRQLPGFKLFYIAVIWSLSTVGLPLIEAWSEGSPIQWPVATYLCAMKILFLIICTLPFDIRDIGQDRHYGLKTLPVMIGRKRAINLTYALLSAHMLLLLIAPYNPPIKMGLALTNCLTFGILTWVFNNKESDRSLTYLLDVALILQFIVVRLMI